MLKFGSYRSHFLLLMVSFPPCKINLGLNVISKRSDGYHDLETCFYPIPWTDILEVVPASHLKFSASGITIPGDTDANLCVKAFHLLASKHNISPVAIHLHKVIPTGAGLGGGSADAAHTIRLLNEVYALNLSVEIQASYAAVLGSDCAFFSFDKPMYGFGRGEILEHSPIQLKDKFLIVVVPPVHVPTKAAFAGITPAKPRHQLRQVIESHPLHEWKELLYNDFEATIFKQYPQLEELKAELYEMGAVYASMSGSGSAVYGIFDQKVEERFSGNNMHCWKGFLPL